MPRARKTSKVAKSAPPASRARAEKAPARRRPRSTGAGRAVRLPQTVRIANEYGFQRVRSSPAIRPDNVLGRVLNGASVKVLGVDGNWASVALQAGGAAVMRDEGEGAATAYLWAPLLGLKDDVTPEPGHPDTPGSGVEDSGHMGSPDGGATVRPWLGVHAMSNQQLAMSEADHGCRFFMLMDSFMAASELKRRYPDAVVMVRRYWSGSPPSVDEALRGLEGAADRGLVYTGLNEGDSVGQGVEDLARRAQFDVELARRIREVSGATYAAGTFSMGTPDFTNPDVCKLMRELYAPHYNSGLLGIDMHNYSPDIAHIDKPDELVWFERRWEFLFTRCGFDPRIRGVYSSETGVDEGGVGGFPAHNTTVEQFRRWCAAFLAAQQRPVVVHGVEYPSPYVGGAIFQLGGNQDTRWLGYDITGYLGALREAY